MIPDAPARFSTTTGWPSALESLSATGRADTSLAPPGGNGTIQRTGFVGQVCAHTGPASAASASATRRRIMLSSSQSCERRKGPGRRGEAETAACNDLLPPAMAGDQGGLICFRPLVDDGRIANTS